MRKKLILISLIFAIAAGVSTYFFLHNLEAKTEVGLEKTQVLVAFKQIGVRQRIPQESIVLKDINKKDILPGAVVDKAYLEDAVTNTIIYPGEQIVMPKLVKISQPVAGLSFKVSTDKRAVTIGVDNVQGIAGLAKPGDTVDVMAIVTPPDTLETKEAYPETLIVAENIKLLAVNQLLGRAEEGVDMATATLEVTPKQAQAIVLATNYGKVHLSLRGFDDEKTTDLPAMNIERLFSGGV